MGYDKCVIAADLRGVGDYCVVDVFYLHYNQLIKQSESTFMYCDAAEFEDIIARLNVKAVEQTAKEKL